MYIDVREIYRYEIVSAIMVVVFLQLQVNFL